MPRPHPLHRSPRPADVSSTGQHREPTLRRILDLVRSNPVVLAGAVVAVVVALVAVAVLAPSGDDDTLPTLASPPQTNPGATTTAPSPGTTVIPVTVTSPLPAAGDGPGASPTTTLAPPTSTTAVDGGTATTTTTASGATSTTSTSAPVQPVTLAGYLSANQIGFLMPSSRVAAVDSFIAVQGFPGDVAAVGDDPTGDTYSCATGADNGVATPGADLSTVVVVEDETTGVVSAAVFTALSPLLSDAEAFSWAVHLQAIDGTNRRFAYEVSGGVRRAGELDAAGNLIPGTEAAVAITADAVVFSFLADPGDLPTLYAAEGFDTPVDGDDVGCDEIVVLPMPSRLALPAPGTCTPATTQACVGNSRFAVTATRSDGTELPVGALSAPGSAALWVGGTPDVLVRVVNGCNLNGSFWVLVEGAPSQIYTARVVDTVTGSERKYTGAASLPAIQDLDAFATCP